MEPTSSENLHIQAIGLSMDICAKIEAGLQVYGARVRVQLHDNWAVAEETAAAQEKVVDLILIHESRAVPCWNDIQAWNEQRSNTPFIVLSEAPDVERIQAAHKSGAADYVEIDSEGRYLVYLPHRILHFIQHRRTLDAHRTAERAVERIATSISASTGRAFFRELTNHITETLGVMYAVVGELKDAESARIRTLSVSRHGKRERNFEYPTVGTPFAVLLDSQHALCTENAQECYPNDSKLKKLGAESYIGVPLLDAKRKVIGMLSVVDNKPIKEPDFLLSALTIFATRTQLELERQRAEILLKGQARILDQLGEAIIGADINGTIKSWNQQAVQLFGRSAQQAIGSSLSSILPHTDEAAARAQLLEPLLIHGNHHVEIPLKRHDGDIFESHLSLSQEKNSQGEVVGVIACCRDISVRMRTERQRREAQQRLAFHVERTPLAFLEWDLQYRIVSWNPSAVRIFGYEPEEILGRPFTVLVEEGFVDDCKRIFEQLIERKGGFSSTNENVTRDGSIITCEWYNTPLMNESGEVVGVASLVNDITERRQAEEALRKSKEAADTANRSKDEFLAVMSHEIRTPMNSIIGFADLLREQAENMEHHDTIDIIKANAYTLLELINNVLNYSRLDSGQVYLERRDVDVHSLLSEVQEAMNPEAHQKGLSIYWSAEDEMPPVVHTDYLELRQILLNLVGNAIKFTSRGEITLSVSAKPVHGKHNRWTYIFAVRDTGVGIPRDKLDTLFQSFSQVDSSSTRAYGGTGLGLAICRKICHLLEGEIWADSVPGRGSTFYFTIEGTVVQNEQTLTQTDLHEMIDDDEPMRILLVEDEAQTRQLLSEILKQMGHDCQTAGSGKSAIEALSRQSFDIIFMDVDMAEMDGQEATRRIRGGEAGENARETYICALTAYANGDDRKACLEAGMNDHLGKPILTKNLRSVISQAKQQRLS